MSDADTRRLALLGLPRTGKSTFLGAFWALAQSPVDESVAELDFAGDRSYVQRLADHVARGEEIPRTDVDTSEQTHIRLGFDGGGAADLLIPDTSGESLRLLVEGHIWHPRLLEVCEGASAVLLFVHPDRVRVPEPVAAPAGAGPGAMAWGDEPTDPVESAVELRDEMCTAAELIDVFENVAELCRERWPIRLGIVVSAWDEAVGASTATPQEWMQARLPGFLSTVEANPEVAACEVFGVSAQGGSLADRDGLIARGEVADRVFARDRDGRPISLAEPVRWAVWGR
jgi:hypothetical protein